MRGNFFQYHTYSLSDGVASLDEVLNGVQYRLVVASRAECFNELGHEVIKKDEDLHPSQRHRVPSGERDAEVSRIEEGQLGPVLRAELALKVSIFQRLQTAALQANGKR